MKTNYFNYEEKVPDEGILVGLPAQKRSILSDTRNIDYLIDLLQAYQRCGQQVAVTYKLVRGWGTREKFHRLFPENVAAERVKKRDDDGYVTLETLLQRKTEVMKDKLRGEGTRILSLGGSLL